MSKKSEKRESFAFGRNPIIFLTAIDYYFDLILEMIDPITNERFALSKRYSHMDNWEKFVLWTKNVAQFGFDIFIFKLEEDKYGLLDKFAGIILKTLMENDSEYIQKYLEYIVEKSNSKEKESTSFLTECLLKFMDILIDYDTYYNEDYEDCYDYEDDRLPGYGFHVCYDQIIENILDLMPTAVPFHRYFKFHFLLEHKLVKKIPDWEDVRKNHSIEIRGKREWTMSWHNYQDSYPDHDWLVLDNIKTLDEISELNNLTNLGVLSLHNCDFSLMKFPIMTNLKVLEISGKEVKIQTIKDKFPNLEILKHNGQYVDL